MALPSARTEHIIEGALRPLDLGTKDRLPVDVHGDEEVGVGQRAANAVEAADRLVFAGKQRDEWFQLERRVGRERSRDESAVAGQLSDVPAGSR